MKILKWFSLEWNKNQRAIQVSFETTQQCNYRIFNTTQEEAFTWLENNGYIERIKHGN